MKEVCDRFEIFKVHGDQYGAAPIGQAMRDVDLQLEEVTFTQQSKADIYGTLRSLIVERQIALPDHPQLLKELRQLEVELMPGGNARIGHPQRGNAHDDYADAVALAGTAVLPDEGAGGVLLLGRCVKALDWLDVFGIEASMDVPKGRASWTENSWRRLRSASCAAAMRTAREWPTEES